MSRGHRLRALLWRWHKRVGLCCVLIVILVTVSGIFLNHTSELGLSQRPVTQTWLLSWYGIMPSAGESYAVASGWVSGDARGHVYFQERRVSKCDGDLRGVVEQPPFIVVACDTGLIVLSQDGDFQERLGSLYDIPKSILRIGLCADHLCLENQQALWQLNMTSLAVTQVARDTAVIWSEDSVVTSSVTSNDALPAELVAAHLNWERVVLDLHSGRLAGYMGVLLVDLAALGLLFLSLSGFLIWYQRAGRRR